MSNRNFKKTFSQHGEGTDITNNKCVHETATAEVWSTLLYGYESWTISKRMESQLEAAEIWFLRRMLRIP